MKLDRGSWLAQYEIAEMIGKGGMGEVYRAHDSRLQREVAIKTSMQEFSDRFSREAKIIASLNHPNICTLFDIGPNYLVMELIEGPAISERINEGAMSLDEAAAIMRQVADALDYAHEKGVVHRDLKPGNIKIRPDGVVKVLDFGLAKVTAALTPASDSAVTLGGTQAGVVLGTAAYMSPEQAMGKPIDKRADVWSFGVVFYEMLTGARMHKGDSMQEVMAAVLKDQPDLTKVPAQAHRLLKRCLEKDPNKRFRQLGDVMALLDDAPSGAGVLSGQAPPASRKRLWSTIAASMVVIAGVALAVWAPWRTVAPAQAVRFEVGPARGMTYIPGAAMEVSPDGRWMVFPANGEDNVPRYYIRALDGVEVRALPGTEMSTSRPPAGWSYDSRWVIFATEPGGKIKKVDIQGGPPQNLADFPGTMAGAAWNADDVIIAGSIIGRSPLLRVPVSGGQTTPITALAPGETAHGWPQFLPDGRHFLYERISPDATKTGVYIGSIDVKPNEQSIQRLLATDRQAYYARLSSGQGHLIFQRQGTLMAQPFDADKMTLSGEAVAIVNEVDSYEATNHGLFSVSNTGTLVFRAGEGEGQHPSLTWFESGNRSGTLGDPGDYYNPAISPDGRRVAVAAGPTDARDIWIIDVARGGSTRFTFDPHLNDFPVWSPDGKSIVFSSDRGGQLDLYIKPSDGSGEEKLLLKTGNPKSGTRWTRDGRFLLFTSVGTKTAEDLWALPMAEREAKPILLFQTPFREFDHVVSPDERWLAYISNESGPLEVYVRPFTPDAPAGTGAKRLVSKGGGIHPRWGADSKTLLYLQQNTSQVMTVDIDTNKGFPTSSPRSMFTAAVMALTNGWDESSDGKRFLFSVPPGTGSTIPFTVVVNWAAGLKK